MDTVEPRVANAARDKSSCSTGGCGGPGLCPGIALLVAFLAGGGITRLTGMDWLGWVVGVPLALVLITGAWRFVPILRPASASCPHEDNKQETHRG